MFNFLAGFVLGRVSKSCESSGGGAMGGVIFFFILIPISIIIDGISDYVYDYYMYINSFVFDDVVKIGESQKLANNAMGTFTDNMLPELNKNFFVLMFLFMGVMFFVLFYLLGKKSEKKYVKIATIIFGLACSFLLTPVLINFLLTIS